MKTKTKKIENYFDFLAPDDIRIKGTRIGIESILYEYIHREKSPEEIRKLFPELELEQIYATLLYYFQHRNEMENYLADWLEFGRRVRTSQKRNPPSVILKLRAKKKEHRQKITSQ